MLFLVELNKTNEVKVWLSIYSYFDVTIIMVIIIKKNNLSNFCLVTTQKFKIIKIWPNNDYIFSNFINSMYIREGSEMENLCLCFWFGFWDPKNSWGLKNFFLLISLPKCIELNSEFKSRWVFSENSMWKLFTWVYKTHFFGAKILVKNTF